jgi:hypothetical protein
MYIAKTANTQIFKIKSTSHFSYYHLFIRTSVNTGMEPRKQTVLARQFLSHDIPFKGGHNDLIVAGSLFRCLNFVVHIIKTVSIAYIEGGSCIAGIDNFPAASRNAI